MQRRSIFWHIFPSSLLIGLVALAAVTWWAAGALRRFDQTSRENGLEARARLVAQAVERLGLGAAPAVEAFVREAGQRTATRLTVILPDGVVVADSEKDAASMENHARRAEIAEALQGRRGVEVRLSQTVFERQLYVAVPLRQDGRIAAVVRASFPLTEVEAEIRGLRRQVVLGGVAGALLVGLLSFVVSRRLSRPIEQLTAGAETFAAGDLAAHLSAPDSTETQRLADALNRMARQLDERLQTVVRERNEKAAVLASMVEGVVAVDGRRQVTDINPAAARWLGADAARACGRPLAEVVRNSALAAMVERTLSSLRPTEEELTVAAENGGRVLHAHGSAIAGDDSLPIGAVIVLHDITDLRRLENLRRDFVANASHELKTPITSILAVAETLRDGGFDLAPEARRFVDIAAKHAARLQVLVEDLLDLSRIEHEAERGAAVLEAGLLRPALEAAIQANAAAARARGIRMELEAAPDLVAPRDPALLEQAVGNLLDNAIKYSPEGGEVRLSAARANGEIVIRVADHGCGIAAEHLPRLFERFYRVDRARSRRLGGTGLGLAIVKHVAALHGGRVSVESEAGRGSTFRIHLPAGPS